MLVNILACKTEMLLLLKREDSKIQAIIIKYENFKEKKKINTRIKEKLKKHSKK